MDETGFGVGGVVVERGVALEEAKVSLAREAGP